MLNQSSTNILLVEDETGLHETLKLNLEWEGYDVTSAYDGLQAMQQAARVSKMEVEQQQDEGEDARRMQKGDVV
jgi:CheY-like chemotaxis protein